LFEILLSVREVSAPGMAEGLYAIRVGQYEIKSTALRIVKLLLRESQRLVILSASRERITQDVSERATGNRVVDHMKELLRRSPAVQVNRQGITRLKVEDSSG